MAGCSSNEGERKWQTATRKPLCVKCAQSTGNSAIEENELGGCFLLLSLRLEKFHWALAHGRTHAPEVSRSQYPGAASIPHLCADHSNIDPHQTLSFSRLPQQAREDGGHHDHSPGLHRCQPRSPARLRGYCRSHSGQQSQLQHWIPRERSKCFPIAETIVCKPA